MKTAVIGGGSWGTALANLLAGKGIDTHLWIRESELIREMRASGENVWFLPGIKLDPALKYSEDLGEVLSGADYFLCVVPSKFMRGALSEARRFMPKRPVVICASKGIDTDGLKCQSEVVFESLEGLDPRYAILSGPSFAKEVARKMPTAVSIGCEDIDLGRELQDIFATDYFRVYANTDYRGVELGGAVKNVIAVGAGIADGLNFGSNARAALITRGLTEMIRFGVAMGAKAETFMGLSGLGDLVLTCTGDLSRNRQVGLKLGGGMTLSEILSETKMVAEGVKTTESLYLLSRKLGVEMPITEQVYAVIYEERSPVMAVRELMCRKLRDE